MPDHKYTIIETVVLAVYAGAGGVLSYLLTTLTANEKPRLSLAVVEGLSSAFVGLVAMLACKGLEIDMYWTGVIVGIFGWMGAKTSMVIFTKILKVRFGLGANNDRTKQDPWK